jgi:glycosyltransferase involved in cell wall biosynthesis
MSRETLAVLTPVLNRPERVEILLASLTASVDPRTVDLNVVWLCSPGDDAEIEAIRQAGHIAHVMRWPAGPGDYAKKMNHGIAITSTQWIFLGADDLRYHPGWFEKALLRQQRAFSCVVGTNDLGNSRTLAGVHSTHSLIHRGYVECGSIDDPKLLHEGYDHQFCDDEFIQTAQARGTYAHAADAIVEHLHPDWGKGVTDATYLKGRARFDADRLLYNSRRHLWKGTHR